MSITKNLKWKSILTLSYIKLKNVLGTFFLVMITFLLINCVGLDIANPNNPSQDPSLSNPDDYDEIVNELFSSLYVADTDWYTMALSTMGDGLTSSWGGGDWGMIGLSREPRTNITNDRLGKGRYYPRMIEDPWNNYYAIIHRSNSVLKQYLDDPSIISRNGEGKDITYQVKAKAKFLQGAAYGSISKIYDKAWVVTESNYLQALNDLPYSTYDEVADQAVQMLTEAINEAKSGDNFNIDAWNGISITRDDFIKVCRSFQAKILVQNARNDDENNATDWRLVAEYASEGVNFNLQPDGDGGWETDWYNTFLLMANHGYWTRIDMRIISLLDPNQPSRFPTDGTEVIGEANFVDKRGNSYLNYDEDIWFRRERGYYYFSHYYMNRFDYGFSTWTGPMPYMMEVENDLNLAEALIRTNGDKNQTAYLINKIRQFVGELPPLTGSETNQTMLEAVFHERFIELLSASPGSVYYDRRRLPEDKGIDFGPLTGLQPCTPRNIPIPPSEAKIFGLEGYGFGGCE